MQLKRDNWFMKKALYSIKIATKPIKCLTFFILVFLSLKTTLNLRRNFYLGIYVMGLKFQTPQNNNLLLFFCWPHVTYEQRVLRSKNYKQFSFIDTKNTFILLTKSKHHRWQLVPLIALNTVSIAKKDSSKRIFRLTEKNTIQLAVRRLIKA